MQILNHSLPHHFFPTANLTQQIFQNKTLRCQIEIHVHLVLLQLESVQNRYLDGNRVLNCSDQTAAQVDEEVKKLLAECYDRAKQIIREHLDSMDKIAQFLIEKETITGKEFMKIYREVENIPEPTEEEMEAAKRGRIYATRAESALVGENVPIKSKKDEQNKEPVEEVKEEPKAETKPEESGDANSTASGDTAGSIFEATVSDEGTQTTSGGRFSHVPEDFDKKD